MKILAALTYYRPHYSGLTIYAERLARALGERGHQVTVLTSRYDRSLPLRERRDGVEIVRLNVGLHVSKGVLMPSMLYWAWKLARRADVVHLHLPQLDAAYIALAARLLGKPAALTYHCDLRLPRGLVHAAANQAAHLANHMAARLANVLVTNTRDYAESSPFLRRYLHKLHPILPPVETVQPSEQARREFRRKVGVQPGQRLIGMAARLATEKGVEYLAEALPMVLQKFPQARVLFAGQYQNVFGEQAYAQRLAPLLQSLGDHWQFLGTPPQEELAAFYHECEVTVLPSLNSTESFGMVQVESMLCGTPVAASDLPGVRQPVRMTGMGRIVPPGDAAALAEAIMDILESPEDFRGDAAEIARVTAPQAVAAAYEQLFMELFGERRERRSQRRGSSPKSSAQ
ncbi:MAG: glycosyltransferase family 4 protein [Chloroflexi bacterium]|nr:glycosyltransferase family 4 protein [Chloroflexota bacterium]